MFLLSQQQSKIPEPHSPRGKKHVSFEESTYFMVGSGFLFQFTLASCPLCTPYLYTLITVIISDMIL